MHPDEERQARAIVDRAEFELASGESSAALRTVDEVLARLADDPLETLRRAALSVRAGALEATGELEAAIKTLMALVAAGSRVDDDWMKSQIALIRCLRENGDIARAISTGEEAVAHLKTPAFEHSTQSIQLIVTLASAYEFAGDSSQAMRLCKRAIEIADRVDSSVARASAYWNASVVEANRGDFESALTLAELVISEFESTDDVRNLGRLRSLVAGLQLNVDPPDPRAALATLDQADRELEWSSAGAVDVARHHRYRGEAYFLLGDHGRAREQLQRCQELTPNGSSTLAASIPVLLGRIAVEERDPERARREYQRAIMILTSIGADRDAARLWLELGDLLHQIGDADGAHDSFQRAAVATGLRRRASTAT